MDSAAPAPILMEKVCRVSGNGQWRITRQPGAQQCQHLLPVQGFGTGRNGDQWRHTIEDAVQHGCQGGTISELIYYSDTSAFYDKYKDEIWRY